MVTAKFGETTKWENGEKGKYPADAATSAIVQMLHKGSAVDIVALKTDSDPDWVLQKLIATGEQSKGRKVIANT